MPDKDKSILSLPSPGHILECIEQWRSIDLTKKSDQEIDKELKESFLGKLGTILTFTRTDIHLGLWRARKLHHIIKNEKEFWEPPPEKTLRGRCNANNNPVLYISKKPKTPFEELSITPEEQVYLIEYKPKAPLTLMDIIRKDLNPKSRTGSPIFNENDLVSYQIIREFIRSEFLKPVGRGTEHLYGISGAMCRVWFRDDSIDGWMYPSVRAPQDLNIALKSNAAHTKLVIKDIRVVRMHHDRDQSLSCQISDNFKPYFGHEQMLIHSEFKGELKSGEFTWNPTDEFLGGII